MGVDAGNRAAEGAAQGSGSAEAEALLWALHAISQLAARETQVEPALRESLALLCKAGGFIAGDALLSPGIRRLAGVGAFHGPPGELLETSSRLELRSGQALAGRALEKRSVAWSAELSDDPRAAALAAAGIASAVACPILVGGEVAGALELFSTSADRPDPLVLAAAEQAAVLLGRVIERAHAQRSLQLGEDIFRSLSEALPVGVVLGDATGKVLYMNPAMEEMAGFGAGESSGARWQQFVEPPDRNRVIDGWRQLVKTGGVFRDDFRFRRGGDLRWCAVLTSAMPGAGGEVRGYVSVFEDMTARVSAEEALRQSEDRFRAIFEGAGVGLALGGFHGSIVRANRAYGDFLGYAAYELSGRNARDLIASEHVPQTMHQLRELEARRIDRVDLERQYLRRDGTRVWGRTTLTRLPDTEMVIAVVQDIDARRRAEDAVRKLSGRFLHLQDEERRRIARSLHESAAQTVAALSMNLQSMERMSLPPQAAETLADSLALATQTSREIRTLSHLLHPPLLEEAGLPSSLRWLVQGFGQRSNVEVSLEIAGDLGRLPTELEITLFRIAQESLTNVHRHSGSRSASVRLRRSGPEVVLEVEDQGIGIPSDILERVQNQSSATVGVGVAGMRERLAQLGGTLEIAPANPGTLVRARLRSEG